MLRPSRRMLVLLAAVALAGLAGCGGGGGKATPAAATTGASEPSAERTVPMVVDTDLAADDLVALSYLASHPRVELLAVTVSGTGEVTCPRGAEIARSFLASVGEDGVPVACGRSEPLSGTREFPAEWRAAADDAWGLDLAPAPSSDTAEDATALLTSAISEAQAPVTLLMLGPLTNAAEALTEQPGLAEELAAVVVMGGAFDVPGNVETDEPGSPLAAEWNLYVDPEAASAVVGSGAPVTLVPLDATNQVPVTEELTDRLAANDRTDATAQVLRLFESWPPAFLWDPLAAIAATDPELVPASQAGIWVVTNGPNAGRTLETANGAAVRVADPPEADTVLDHLLRTLAGVPADEPLAAPTAPPVVAELSVGFDGETCTVHGPTDVPPGAAVVTLSPGPTPYDVVVAHLVEGATVEEALAWVAEHPGESPPMLDQVVLVGEGGVASPATIELLRGDTAIACASEGRIVLGETVTVAA